MIDCFRSRRVSKDLPEAVRAEIYPPNFIGEAYIGVEIVGIGWTDTRWRIKGGRNHRRQMAETYARMMVRDYLRLRFDLTYRQARAIPVEIAWKLKPWREEDANERA